MRHLDDGSAAPGFAPYVSASLMRGREVGHTPEGWRVFVGDTLLRNGQPVKVMGREGNVMLVRGMAPPSPRPVNPDRAMPTHRVHPAEVGVVSTITLPHYIK